MLGGGWGVGVEHWDGEERKTVGRVPNCPPFFRLSDSFMYSMFLEKLYFPFLFRILIK